MGARPPLLPGLHAIGSLARAPQLDLPDNCALTPPASLPAPHHP